MLNNKLTSICWGNKGAYSFSPLAVDSSEHFEYLSVSYSSYLYTIMSESGKFGSSGQTAVNSIHWPVYTQLIARTNPAIYLVCRPSTLAFQKFTQLCPIIMYFTGPSWEAHVLAWPFVMHMLTPDDCGLHSHNILSLARWYGTTSAPVL